MTQQQQQQSQSSGGVPDVTNMLFQDAMDSERFLKIKTVKDKTVIAKIYFGPDKNNLVLSGVVELGKKLFFLDGGSRWGFNPAREPMDPKLAALKDAAKRRYNDDDDDRRGGGRRY